MSVSLDRESQFHDQQESGYPNWWSRERLFLALRSAHMDTTWNCCICFIVLVAVIWVILEIQDPLLDAIDLLYNIVYGVHVASIVYSTAIHLDSYNMSFSAIVRLVLDFMSFLHYAMWVGQKNNFKLFCYYLRFNRPFKYLWTLNDYSLQGSVLGTALKYFYLFLVLKISWALVWLYLFEVEYQGLSVADEYLCALFTINTMFIPIGPSVDVENDKKRIIAVLVMMTGCLVVTGMAVASLSLVITIYMQPEEAFRERYRLIMKEMKESKVPPRMSEKVRTFYKMYWHKQRAVSATQLLPTFPPTLPNTIYTDIYFEATQKSRVLRDLSYEFLSKVAKVMYTVLYIPGDTIIQRNKKKSHMIFIAYGDVEMLSAEDDSTAMLRMTRGTALSSCACGVPAACARAYVDIRAATFCITQVISARDLWLVALKHARHQGQNNIILDSFYGHLQKVKFHHLLKATEEVKYKSSIYHFKRKLMALKEAKDERGNLILGRSDVFLEIAGSYIMRKRADESLTNEADAICLRGTFPCILQPISSLQLAWHSFISILIIIVCFTHPYYLVFMKEVPLGFRFYDYVVTLLYVLDLIVHLSTGANVEAGVPITFAQTSSQQMRSRWFVLDVVGTLPIFEFISDGHFGGINKLLRLPKAFRMMKILQDKSVYNRHALRYLYYTLVLLMGCYFIATLQQGFMCFEFQFCLVGNFTHTPYWENKTLDDDVGKRLAFALYWAVNIMTFTDHKEAWSLDEWNRTMVLYTLVLLEVCILTRIFIEAVYSATITVTTVLREDYDSCINNVKNFLVRNEVDPRLRQRFIAYLQLCWFTDKAYSMTNKKGSIFHDLPAYVYQDIVVRQRSKYLLSIPFMKLLNHEDLKNVSSKAKLFHTSPNEVLLNTGDISNEMFVIKRGMFEILDPVSQQAVGTLGIKDYFGVIECLFHLPAYYTVRAVTHVQIYSISNKILDKAVDLPKIKDAIEFAKDLPEYSRLMKAHHESFQTYIPPAPAPNIERFRRPRKYETDHAYLQPFYQLGFFSILRYIFPRFTIRPDGAYLMRYEWARAVCALLSSVVYPPYTYLEMQWPAIYYLALLLDISAYFDIIQRMLVGYFNAEGALVYHPSSTAGHYLKGAFIVDLFACLPMEDLESSTLLPYGASDVEPEPGSLITESQRGQAIRTVIRQVLMLNRLLQLYRLPSAMLSLQGYIERRDILLVMKAIPLFLVTLNTFTSLMIFTSAYILMEDGMWDIVPFNDKGGSWLYLFQNTFRFNMTESPWNLYLGTFFWMTYEATSTGYGCFNPSNIMLMIVLFVGTIIGSSITTYFSVRILSVRANVNKELAAYQEHMKDIVVFMQREDLPLSLQRDVLHYYEYNWDRTGGINYTNVLKLCDQITLRTDAILHIYGTTFKQCPFLAQCDISLLRIIGRSVRSVYFLKDMLVVDVDDVIGAMYFVDSGVISVKKRRDGSSTSALLGKGSVFGNLEDVPSVRFASAIVAQTMAHVLRIKAATFYHIIQDFPQVAKEMESLRTEDENFIMGKTDTDIIVKRRTTSLILFRGQKKLHYYYLDKYFQAYLMLISLACVYADVYNAGYQLNTIYLIVLLYILDGCFYLKILLYYIFPYMTDSVRSRKTLLSIRKSYFKYEFKYDVISCLPFELICLVCDEHKWILFSWLRLNRMFRIVTAYKSLVRNRERITFNLTLSTVISVLIWFTLFVHTTACLWHFIALMEDTSSPKTSWMYKLSGESWCDNRYICSVYFIVTTFTGNGVGDIMPKNRTEVAFVSVLQIVSTMLYMIYVGEFSNLIQYRSFRSFRYYCKYLELQEFLRNNRVSKNLVTLVNKYSLHLWRECRGKQVPYFLKTAPQALRLRVMAAAYLHHLENNPVFMACEPAFLRQLVGYLHLYTYDEGLYVVRKSEITDSMYMIHTGRVREISYNKRIFTTMKCFGVEQGLFHDVPFPYSYHAVTKAQILSLKLSDWEDLLKHFPSSKRAIYKHFIDDDAPGPSGGLTTLTKNVDHHDKDDSSMPASDDFPSKKRGDIIVTPPQVQEDDTAVQRQNEHTALQSQGEDTTLKRQKQSISFQSQEKVTSLLKQEENTTLQDQEEDTPLQRQKKVINLFSEEEKTKAALRQTEHFPSYSNETAPVSDMVSRKSVSFKVSNISADAESIINLAALPSPGQTDVRFDTDGVVPLPDPASPKQSTDTDTAAPADNFYDKAASHTRTRTDSIEAIMAPPEEESHALVPYKRKSRDEKSSQESPKISDVPKVESDPELSHSESESESSETDERWYDARPSTSSASKDEERVKKTKK